MVRTFADDTVLMARDTSQRKVKEKLHGYQTHQAESAKYFVHHPDGRLNWMHHVRQKGAQ